MIIRNIYPWKNCLNELEAWKLQTRENGRSVATHLYKLVRMRAAGPVYLVRALWTGISNFAIIMLSAVTHQLLHFCVFGFIRLGVWRRDTGCPRRWSCYCRYFLLTHKRKTPIRRWISKSETAVVLVTSLSREETKLVLGGDYWAHQ